MPTLPFVHSWIAASAVALAAVPILIHIWNRRRYRRMVWAAMGFLAAAQRRSARRIRIEQLILLAVRVLIMVLIALAVARPLVRPAGPLAIGRTSHHRLIVLDDSYSMGMVRADGKRAFDRGVSAALRLVETFGRNDGVSLILAARPARALIEKPNYDRQAVAAALKRRGLSGATTDMAGALDSAADVLSESDLPPASRMIYVVTDGTASAWAGPGGEPMPAVRAAARRAAEQARVLIVDVGPDERDNLALSSLRLAAPTMSADWPAALLAEVTNHGRQEARGLKLQVGLDGQVVRTESVQTVGPGETRPVRFRLQLPNPGSHQVQARVVGTEPDVLPLDDVRWASLSVRDRVQVLLVDGRPGAERFSGQTGYLAAALAPKTGPADPALVSPRIIMSGELATEPLSDHAMVALCNVRQLGGPTWDRLSRYVREGGSVIVYLGDQVSVDDYNRFGFAEGRGILPARIVGLAGSEGDREKFVRLRAEGLLHPAIVDFAGQPRSGLFLARFYRYARLAVPTDLDGAAAVMAYENGDCAVAARSVGRGRVAMVGFGASMDWTNLPAKGDYVSFSMGLLAWAVGDPAANRNLLVGETLSEVLSGRAASLPVTVVGPDDGRGQATLTSQPTSDRVVARYEQTGQPGAYKLAVGPRTVDFSVNLDPSEGNLARTSPRALRETLGIAFDYAQDVDEAVRTAASGGRREIGWLLLWIVLGLAAVEMLLAMWFGHHRG